MEGRKSRSLSWTLPLWYAFFGACHEFAHLLTAVILGLGRDVWVEGITTVLGRALIERHCVLPGLEDSNASDFNVGVVRHIGWFFSVLLAFGVARTAIPTSKEVRFASFVTALEALSTDLFSLNVLPILTKINSSGSISSVLFCGNFGIILLHQAWLSDNGKSAMDILERMIKVTMMRGAQSGGVVTFQPLKNSLRGMRSRVVNKKRTDLSVLVRKEVERDAIRSVSRPFPESFVQSFSGHTRFATSSKASLDGTHPHLWTPASNRRLYNFSVRRSGPHQYMPETTKVENYITHNGDFDFYIVNGQTFDLEVIQKWLPVVTGFPMPSSVDSCAVAGVIDLLRTQGCFGLSARCAICFGLSTSKMEEELFSFPTYEQFEQIGLVFEEAMDVMLQTTTFSTLCDDPNMRHSFSLCVLSKLKPHRVSLLQPIQRYICDEEEGGANLLSFCLCTINAFFDNDLLMATTTFLKNAKGSFGLCVTSSIDAHRQICLAARGQTMSIAFYPSKGLVCYGSEQASVKAGMNTAFPGAVDELGTSRGDIDADVLRLDLDDLGGEIMCLDWGGKAFRSPAVSLPHRHLVEHVLMKGSVKVVLVQESKTTTQRAQLFHRMTRLSRNPLIKMLAEESKDLVLSDINDIPRACQAIQDDWDSNQTGKSMNRLTAYNLSCCLRKRLEMHLNGPVHNRAVDILLTGCEVSLWLAEQFATDLQKAFPRLRTKAISSNKLLGLYGQELAVPSIGFPYSPRTYDLNDAIVVIVSHSGGTFAPLACSNLLQSTTKNIFVVTSEWDTQIGKQLRTMDGLMDASWDHLFSSRIFSTEVGMRPAEPCSVTVAATQQLLTNLFQYISAVILSDERFRQVVAATISEQDLRILEKCNRENIAALSDIVGVNECGFAIKKQISAEIDLRKAGNLWAEHVLENAKAYIMTFVYIFVTVVSGYPLIYAISYACGLDDTSNFVHLIRVLDAAIYFWLPQINVALLRLFQSRELLHRMGCRTVAIADIPWVAQSAEAFLSKIFACSYSIAGINVLSGNPNDHFVHRHTHRVVRGALVLCGRPDGRLSALATAEATVCLSVNQASSIQSLGGTCESITVGHNPFKLPLTKFGIFLKSNRPQFLCERMLVEKDAEGKRNEDDLAPSPVDQSLQCEGVKNFTQDGQERHSELNMALSSSVHLLPQKTRSASALLGAYTNIAEQADRNRGCNGSSEHSSIDEVLYSAIQERSWSNEGKKLFEALDVNSDGLLSEDEVIDGLYRLETLFLEDHTRAMFKVADGNSSGHVDFDEFLKLLDLADIDGDIKVPSASRDERGNIRIEPSHEEYFGETLRKFNAGKTQNNVEFRLARSQHFSQELYESRIASLQRFVSMTVIFHQMGRRVEQFFETISFGLLGYRMDRTHSIMRIATTASPVSGADVRHRMNQLQLQRKIHYSIHVISKAYLRYRARKQSCYPEPDK